MTATSGLAPGEKCSCVVERVDEHPAAEGLLCGARQHLPHLVVAACVVVALHKGVAQLVHLAATRLAEVEAAEAREGEAEAALRCHEVHIRRDAEVVLAGHHVEHSPSERLRGGHKARRLTLAGGGELVTQRVPAAKVLDGGERPLRLVVDLCEGRVRAARRGELRQLRKLVLHRQALGVEAKGGVAQEVVRDGVEIVRRLLELQLGTLRVKWRSRDRQNLSTAMLRVER